MRARGYRTNYNKLLKEMKNRKAKRVRVQTGPGLTRRHMDERMGYASYSVDEYQKDPEFFDN